jgi:signal transduction histidine kinase/Tfp pilus assembly protein PilF
LKFLLIIALGFTPFLSLGQDSLLNSLRSARGSVRLDILESLSQKFRNESKQSAIYAREAVVLSISLKDTASTITSMNWLGQLKKTESAYDSARYFYTQALTLSQRSHNSPAVSQNINGIGVTYQLQGQITQALELYLEALSIAEACGDQKQVSDSYYNIGYVHNLQQHYDSALVYFRKALGIREILKDTAAIAGSYNSIGLALMRMEKYDEARDWYFKSKKMLDPEEHTRLLSMIYNNIGITYENQGKFEEGRTYYFKSIELKKKMNDTRGLASTYGNLSDNYNEAGNPDKSIEYAILSLRLAKATQSLDYMITAHKILSHSFEKKLDYENAYNHYVEFKTLEDSLSNENTSRHASELIAKYNVSRKEKENESLKASAAVKELLLSKQKVIIICTVVSLVLLLMLFGFVYQLYIKSKTLTNEVRSQKIEADAANVRLQEVLQENTMMMNVMVHDLRAPMNKVQGLADLIQADGALNPHQVTYLSMMSGVVEQGRRIIDDLLTINKRESLTVEKFLCNDFLRELIQLYTSEASRKHLQLKLNLTGANVMIETDKNVLSRILDNLISNAIKFSPPEKSILVNVSQDEQFVHIQVCDQGPGFSEDDHKHVYQRFKKLSARPTGGESSTGLGLAIVKHLVEQLNGNITLISKAQQGGVFNVSLPMFNTAYRPGHVN